ncbi:MAG: Type II secretion system protein E [Planctomycetes bacterium ADurb.Bin401]|nr:MAG: Type II secretion system protein E [Planctomycetes bacterium ADurb.Bin401]
MKKLVEKSIGPVEKFYRGLGCKKCRNAGYLGRIAIHELFVPNPVTQEMIMEQSSLKLIREEAVKAGMSTLRTDGLNKVKAGITTIEEVLRVSNSDPL